MNEYTPSGGVPPGNGAPPQSGPDAFSPPPGDPALDLRRDANYVGFIVVLLVFLYELVPTAGFLLLQAAGLADLGNATHYGMGYWPYVLVTIVMYCLYIGLAGPLISAVFRRSVKPFARLDAPRGGDRRARPSSVAAAVTAGMGFVILIQYLAAFIQNLLQNNGYKVLDQDSLLRNNLPSLLVCILMSALLPALLEEMLFRGYILRGLLRFGNGTAILLSSLIFGLIHTEPVQALFAFGIGCICGYLAVSTRSIWPGAALHFLNNLMSVLVSYFAFSMTEKHSHIFSFSVMAVVWLIGMFGLVVLIGRRDPLLDIMPGRNTPDNALPVSAKDRRKALITAAALLAGMILLLVQCIVLVVLWQM